MREAGQARRRGATGCAGRWRVPGTTTLRDRPGRRGAVRSARRDAAVQGLPRQGAVPGRRRASRLNEEVVHGIPGQRQISDGDLLKIDTACKLNGWCADAAVTLLVGEVTPEKTPAGRGGRAGAADRDGRDGRGERWWSEVATAMQRVGRAGRLQRRARSTSATASAGSCTRTRRCRTSSDGEVKKHDFRLEEGLVLAVEPMVNMGKADTLTLSATTGRW